MPIGTRLRFARWLPRTRESPTSILDATSPDSQDETNPGTRIPNDLPRARLLRGRLGALPPARNLPLCSSDLQGLINSLGEPRSTGSAVSRVREESKLSAVDPAPSGLGLGLALPSWHRGTSFMHRSPNPHVGDRRSLCQCAFKDWRVRLYRQLPVVNSFIDMTTSAA